MDWTCTPCLPFKAIWTTPRPRGVAKLENLFQFWTACGCLASCVRCVHPLRTEPGRPSPSLMPSSALLFCVAVLAPCLRQIYSKSIVPFNTSYTADQRVNETFGAMVVTVRTQELVETPLFESVPADTAVLLEGMLVRDVSSLSLLLSLSLSVPFCHSVCAILSVPFCHSVILSVSSCSTCCCGRPLTPTFGCCRHDGGQL